MRHFEGSKTFPPPKSSTINTETYVCLYLKIQRQIIVHHLPSFRISIVYRPAKLGGESYGLNTVILKFKQPLIKQKLMSKLRGMLIS